MNRRTAIQHMIILGAGASLLAACQDNPTVLLKHLPLTGTQENLLAAMTETMIPSTPEFIGAKELQSHRFLLMMVDDCSATEEQTKFMNGMLQFTELCKKKFDTRFVKLTPEQKTEFLVWVEAQTDLPEEVIGFYRTVKRFAIQSFTTSEAYLTQVRNFSLIPGKYQGCVPVATV